MRVVVAGFLSMLLVLCGVVLLPGIARDWAATLTYVVIGPGVYVCRWFLSPRFATPSVRLWIIAAVNFALYWPAFLFLVSLIPDRRRLWRSITPRHAFEAVALGAGASAVAWILTRKSPLIFGILNTPGSGPLWIVSLAAGPRLLRWSSLTRLVCNLIGYAVITFFALFRLRWRKPADA